MLMNNNFVITQAKQFAARLRKEAGNDTARASGSRVSAGA